MSNPPSGEGVYHMPVQAEVVSDLLPRSLSSSEHLRDKRLGDADLIPSLLQAPFPANEEVEHLADVHVRVDEFTPCA